MSSKNLIDGIIKSMSSRSTDFLQKIVPIGQAVTNERASVAFSQLGHKNMSQAVSLPSNLQGSKSLGPMQPSETLPQPSSCGARGSVTCTASEWGTPLESLTASLTQKQDTHDAFPAITTSIAHTTSRKDM